MHTEDEAKTKWCPFAKRVAYGDKTATRDIMNDGIDQEYVDEMRATFPCIGSACMAFRWLPDVTAILSGNTVVVDAEDADLLDGCWWDGRYPRNDADRLHRLVAVRAFGEIPPEMLVDHIDGDTGNCRRGNIRIVTKAQNAANAAPRGGDSRYRGVFRAKNRWAAQIARGGVRMHLGTFDTEEQAAAAYDEAAERIHGAFARLNLKRRVNSGRQGFCGLAGKP